MDRVHRVHAPFVTEKEIAAVVEFWRSQGQVQYQEKFLEAPRDDTTPRWRGWQGSAEMITTNFSRMPCASCWNTESFYLATTAASADRLWTSRSSDRSDWSATELSAPLTGPSRANF